MQLDTSGLKGVNNMFKYNLKVDLSEWALIFGSLQRLQSSNETVMESLNVLDKETFQMVITHQEKYDRLAKENSDLQALLTKLYDDTNEQLKASQ